VGKRRPMGSLEAGVLDVLWQAGSPLTPAQVLEALDQDLAYTTVMTVLTRLYDKGIVARARSGRAYSYVPVVSEAELAATRMRTALAETSDQMATMSRFVGSLSDEEAEALRAVLREANP
jgi:predicted transcriptional regulator